ncbi:MAG: hypothetical protein ACK5T0_09320, partial [Vampirovibrionales bacterium]
LLDIDTRANSISLNLRIDLQNKLIKETEVANCGELTEFFQHLLYEVGLSTVKILMNIRNQAKTRVCADHVFLVAGLDPKANLFDPCTYGEHALYLDPWWKTNTEKGLFLPVQQGIEKIKKAFEIDLTAGESLSFQSVDDYCNASNGYKFPKFATVDQLLPKFKIPKP